MTGWGATVSDEVMEAHAIDFVIGKPFEVGTLTMKVNEVLTARGSEAPAPRGVKPRRSASPSGTRPT